MGSEPDAEWGSASRHVCLCSVSLCFANLSHCNSLKLYMYWLRMMAHRLVTGTPRQNFTFYMPPILWQCCPMWCLRMGSVSTGRLWRHSSLLATPTLLRVLPRWIHSSRTRFVPSKAFSSGSWPIPTWHLSHNGCWRSLQRWTWKGRLIHSPSIKPSPSGTIVSIGWWVGSEGGAS